MTVRSISGLALLLCVSSALAFHFRARVMRLPVAPPSFTETGGRWHWAAAGPGVNIYYAFGPKAADGTTSAWVAHRFFRNLAGISKDLVAQREFDCRRHRSRPLPTGTVVAETASAWEIPRGGTTDEHLLRLVCAHSDADSP
jgi:hypothetical protein